MATLEDTSEITEEIKDSYIRQNLPVRRQSLIVYQDKLRSEQQDEQPKRHASMMDLSTAPHTTNRLYNSKSMNSLSPKKHNRPNPPLSIQIDSQTIQTSNSSQSSGSSSSDFFMDTLFEEEPQQPSQRIPRFIGRLKQSKSDTTHRYNPTKRRPSDDTSSPLAQSWNDMSQPLFRLKNVFSRLQTTNNNCDTRKRTSIYSQELRKRKNKWTDKKKSATVYTALLSHVSSEFLKRIQLSAIAFKDGIQYHDVFSGSVAVDCILEILNTNDRNLALLVGRALENQGFFHHVNYDHRLRDLEIELYQFQYVNNTVYDALPTASSNKLLPLKKSNRKHVPSICETLPINGVFSVLTDCYSPTCTRKNPCYSISCPRKMTKNKNVQRPLSSYFLRTEQELQLRSLWRHSVPLNIVLGTNDIEQKRQECIYELIYTEDDFTRDLHYVQDFWIEPLLHGDIIPIERRHEFITDVFWNWADIERISTNLSKDLTLRQDKHSVIPCIGDILLEHVEGFEPFVIYGAHQIIGKHTFELEKKRNPKFLQFVEKLERQPESRRLELNGYLTKPTSRLGRYNLLLNAIHQLTPKEHKDYQDIPKVIDKITRFLVQLNKRVGLSDNAFHLEQISNRILAPKGHNLNLLDPKRQLLMRGKMKKCGQYTNKNTNHVVIPSLLDIQVFLFDHYLVFCKIKHQDGLDYYKLYQKPILVKHLHAFIPHSVIIPPTKSFSTSHIYSKLSPSTFQNSISDMTPPPQTKTHVFPLSFSNKQDTSPSPITFLVSTDSTRHVWLNKIEEAQQQQ
ncbi:uncharacterized protein B0P05DRAFT_553060 [Gilbertella persicaria]|uniref:uncharacterized protein n=1 Tax=Gilbertella persicaria TaxID=101096 RepID=UPI002220FA8D|nr:uncharacterized protein B0P05DRAFT_553060 [Gilbertella persicaria]KAI8066976.1 hypothetical protein B0P05DRAFT_553060 [Gilbertella persicaria]